ncbi:hypothetical protein VNI00_013309 [Paramarasmius palmivorus]|uniref:Uncharacterized protein n=1 Tax=Paramarasmius palmivorus TaxID=297713 RepID=A0AAW0BYX2_9AGAR
MTGLIEGARTKLLVLGKLKTARSQEAYKKRLHDKLPRRTQKMERSPIHEYTHTQPLAVESVVHGYIEQVFITSEMYLRYRDGLMHDDSREGRMGADSRSQRVPEIVL